MVNGGEIRPTGFIADVKTWFFETENEGEAYYLSAIFNSELLSKRMMKPWQPKGLFGARAIHRRSLLFPIPRYDCDNCFHVELVDIGRTAHSRMRSTGFIQKNNLRLRAEVRRKFKNEITRINQIVAELKIGEAD